MSENGKKPAVEFARITQRALEAFADTMPKDNDDIPLIKYRSLLVRAAAGNGWLGGKYAELQAKQVEDLEAAEVLLLANAITAKVKELTAIDPN